MAQATGPASVDTSSSESLEALGAEVAFGLPGIHALAIWEGLSESSVRYLGFRTELNAGFRGRRLRARQRPAGAAPALDRARGAQLAHGPHGGLELTRSRRRDRESDPDRA